MGQTAGFSPQLRRVLRAMAAEPQGAAPSRVGHVLQPAQGPAGGPPPARTLPAWPSGHLLSSPSVHAVARPCPLLWWANVAGKGTSADEIKAGDPKIRLCRVVWVGRANPVSSEEPDRGGSEKPERSTPGRVSAGEARAGRRRGGCQRRGRSRDGARPGSPWTRVRRGRQAPGAVPPLHSTGRGPPGAPGPHAGPPAAGAAVPPLRAALCVQSVAWKRHGRLPPGASAECCSAAEGPRWLHGPAPGVLLSGRATLQRPRPGRSHARDTLETGFRSSTRVSGGR